MSSPAGKKTAGARSASGGAATGSMGEAEVMAFVENAVAVSEARLAEALREVLERLGLLESEMAGLVGRGGSASARSERGRG